MGPSDPESIIRDLLRAMELCATGATVHGLNNARQILAETLRIHRSEQSAESQQLLDRAARRARIELACAVWSCG